MAWVRRFESWPPGISWRYTRPVGQVGPVQTALEWRTAAQYGSRLETASSERPVARSVWAVAATRAVAWLTGRSRQRGRTSTASTPARLPRARRQLSTGGVVGVQVNGKIEALRSAETSLYAASARSRPAMSLTQSMWHRRHDLFATLR